MTPPPVVDVDSLVGSGKSVLIGICAIIVFVVVLILLFSRHD